MLNDFNQWTLFVSSHSLPTIILNGISAESDIAQTVFDQTVLVAVSDTIPRSESIEWLKSYPPFQILTGQSSPSQ
jgi:hypothetical protein